MWIAYLSRWWDERYVILHLIMADYCSRSFRKKFLHLLLHLSVFSLCFRQSALVILVVNRMMEKLGSSRTLISQKPFNFCKFRPMTMWASLKHFNVYFSQYFSKRFRYSFGSEINRTQKEPVTKNQIRWRLSKTYNHSTYEGYRIIVYY